MAGIERLKGSRYAKSSFFSQDEKGDRVFNGIRPRKIGPAIGVIEHVLAIGERLDLLALQYYNDSSLWWRIVDANPDIVFAGDLMVVDKGKGRVGTVIVIPRATRSGGG